MRVNSPFERLRHQGKFKKCKPKMLAKSLNQKLPLQTWWAGKTRTGHRRPPQLASKKTTWTKTSGGRTITSSNHSPKPASQRGAHRSLSLLFELTANSMKSINSPKTKWFLRKSLALGWWPQAKAATLTPRAKPRLCHINQDNVVALEQLDSDWKKILASTNTLSMASTKFGSRKPLLL